MTATSSEQPQIALRHVTRDVTGSKGKVTRLLTNVSWELRPGERVGVIAGSMQEAHAFLDCAAGITTPQRGEVSIQAHVSWPVGAKGGLLTSLTGRQNARFLQGIYGHGGEQWQDLNQIQVLADLEEGYFDKPLRTYNKFMRARFNLAVALAFDFDVYIVPKQFAWKSKATSERLLRLQAALKDRLAGKSILMTNTDFDFIAEFCDQGLVLDQGAIVYSGSFADCRAWYDTNIHKAPEEDIEAELDAEDATDPAGEGNNQPDDDLW